MKCEVCHTRVNNGICDTCGTHHKSRIKRLCEKSILDAGFKKNYIKKYNFFQKLIKNKEDEYYFSFENCINIVLKPIKYSSDIYMIKETNKYLTYYCWEDSPMLKNDLKKIIKDNSRLIKFKRVIKNK